MQFGEQLVLLHNAFCCALLHRLRFTLLGAKVHESSFFVLEHLEQVLKAETCHPNQVKLL